MTTIILSDNAKCVYVQPLEVVSSLLYLKNKDYEDIIQKPIQIRSVEKVYLDNIHSILSIFMKNYKQTKKI